MTYRLFIMLICAFTILSGFLVLPAVLDHIRNDPEITQMAERPIEVFRIFSACKNKVNNEELCYKAYSAAVQLANKPDCSREGIAQRLRFKGLVEHARPQDIIQELKKDCPRASDSIGHNSSAA